MKTETIFNLLLLISALHGFFFCIVLFFSKDGKKKTVTHKSKILKIEEVKPSNFNTRFFRIMKPTTPVLLAILILFQSCYSYKKVDIQNLKIDASKKYAIKTKKVNGRKFKLTILKITDTEIIVQKRKKRIIIPKAKILKIEEMKFSYWRTGIITTATLIITTLIILLSNLNFDFDFGGNFLDGII